MIQPGTELAHITGRKAAAGDKDAEVAYGEAWLKASRAEGHIKVMPPRVAMIRSEGQPAPAKPKRKGPPLSKRAKSVLRALQQRSLSTSDLIEMLGMDKSDRKHAIETIRRKGHIITVKQNGKTEWIYTLQREQPIDVDSTVQKSKMLDMLKAGPQRTSDLRKVFGTADLAYYIIQRLKRKGHHITRTPITPWQSEYELKTEDNQ